MVESRADVFRDSGGAKKDLGAYESELRSEPGAKAVSVPRLGDAAVGATISRSGPLPVVFYVIAWRDRNATASVNVNGFSRKITLADAVALARKQERRISAH